MLPSRKMWEDSDVVWCWTWILYTWQGLLQSCSCNQPFAIHLPHGPLWRLLHLASRTQASNTHFLLITLSLMNWPPQTGYSQHHCQRLTAKGPWKKREIVRGWQEEQREKASKLQTKLLSMGSGQMVTVIAANGARPLDLRVLCLTAWRSCCKQLVDHLLFRFLLQNYLIRCWLPLPQSQCTS